MADYEIRLNNAAVRGFCPYCGRDFKPSFGPWPFQVDSWNPLCEDCADGLDLTTPEARRAMELELNAVLPGSWSRYSGRG